MVSLGLFMSAILLLLKVALLLIYAVQWRRGLAEDGLHNLLKAIILLNAFIYLAAGSFTLSRRGKMPNMKGSPCETADADLIGDGVFYGIFVQEALLILMATCGLFHRSLNAMKEIGAGLLLTHTSLLISLLVPIACRWVLPLACRKPLSMVDAILGSMILDSENAALSIQLFSKETMASRLQVYLVLISQGVGITVISIIVDSFTRGLLYNKEGGCFSVFWWGWINNCPKAIPNNIMPFWVYIALRSVVLLQFAVISIREISEYKRAEKEDCQRPCMDHRNCEACGCCHRCNYMKPPCELAGECPDCSRCVICGRLSESQPRYSDRYATSSPVFVEAACLAALPFFGLLSTITDDHDIKPTSEIYSVGQVTAIVVAAVTCIRSFWVFIRGQR